MVKLDPNKRGTNVLNLKEQYLVVFERVPYQRMAAEMIGRDEDTIIRWKKKDKQFAERIKEVEILKVGSWVEAAKPEFLLERTYPRYFGRHHV